MLIIGIQNTPEGFSVAFSYFAHNPKSKLKSALIGIQSGLIEIPLTIVGVLLVDKAEFFTSLRYGFWSWSNAQCNQP